ncbi:MAG: hypothetical protein ABIA02_02645 [Candidatus Falkowbacteria bacterium]
MTLRSYLIVMSIATILCFSAFVFVLITINPEITNWVGFLLFYSSLFLTTAGVSAIVGFLIRFIALKRELAFHAVRSAFRQSFLFAFAVASILFLLSKDVFTWMNLILLIIGLSVLEFFLINYER